MVVRCAWWWNLEGRLLAEVADRRRPRVVRASSPGPGAAIAGAARTAGTVMGTGDLGDRRRRVAQRRADLVDLQLHDGALLTLLGAGGRRDRPVVALRDGDG